MGDDISKGITLIDGHSFTAAIGNTLVDAATIKTSFFTGKPEITSSADADVFLVQEASSGLYKKIQKQNFVSVNNVQTGFRYLTATNNAVTPLTKIDVYAEEITMRSAAGNVRRVAAFTATLDLTSYAGASTANGRDYTPIGSNFFGGIWAISDGSNDRLLWSQGATPLAAITLPTSYIYFCLLGVVWLNNSGQLIPFYQRGNSVAIQAASDAATAASTLNPTIGGTEFTNLAIDATAGAGNWVAVSLTKCVPPLATRVQGIVGSTQAATSLTVENTYGVAAKAAGTLFVPTSFIGGTCGMVLNQSGGTGPYAFSMAIPFEVPIHTSQTIYVAVNKRAATAEHSMRITGYTLNL